MRVDCSFPFLSGDEPHPAPTPPPNPVIAVPNLTAKPLKRDPSPAPSNSSEEEVNDMLDNEEYPNQQPITPPPCESTPLITPDQCRSTPTTPPPCPSATHISNQPVSPDLQLLGGYNERIHRVQLLHEMDWVPRWSTRVPVPNPRYFNPDNVTVDKSVHKEDRSDDEEKDENVENIICQLLDQRMASQCRDRSCAPSH